MLETSMVTWAQVAAAAAACTHGPGHTKVSVAQHVLETVVQYTNKLSNHDTDVRRTHPFIQSKVQHSR